MPGLEKGRLQAEAEGKYAAEAGRAAFGRKTEFLVVFEASPDPKKTRKYLKDRSGRQTTWCQTALDFEPPAAKLVWSQDLGAKLL